jgi:FdhE protein
VIISSTWDQRIARAEELAGVRSGGDVCAASDLLRFYTHVARVQQNVYEALPDAILARADGRSIEPLMQAESLALLRPYLLDVLAIARNQGPEKLAERASQLAGSSREQLTSLLHDYWGREDFRLDRFFAAVILHAAAERLAEGFVVPEQYEGGNCPFCGSAPLLGVLRPENLGARRSLLCSFCACEWPYRRVQCPMCGEDRNDRLSIYTPEAPKYVRIDACETCKMYVKTIDLSLHGTAVPIVDDIATVSLALWASENGYHRSAANIFNV